MKWPVENAAHEQQGIDLLALLSLLGPGSRAVVQKQDDSSRRFVADICSIDQHCCAGLAVQ